MLIGGIVFALFAATFYWFPKMTGRMLDERLGKWQFWLWVIGFNGTFGVQHLLGFMGMPRRVYTYGDNPGWALLNGISSASSFFMAAGTLVLVWNVLVSLRRGVVAGDNPWDAFTLEWATTSPPPPENFDSLPEIRSRRPLWDANHPGLADWQASNTPEDTGGRPDAARVGAASFIVSEAIFFVLLLVTYLVFNTGNAMEGPTAATVLDAKRTGCFTILSAEQQRDVLVRRTLLTKGQCIAVPGLAGPDDPAGRAVSVRSGLGVRGFDLRRRHHQQKPVRVDIFYRHRISWIARGRRNRCTGDSMGAWVARSS